MKKRIVIISDWYLPRFGGIELYLRDLTGALQASGLDVEVITPIPGPSIVNSVRVHRLCDSDIPNGGYFFPPCSSASNARDFLYILELFLRPRKQSAMLRLRELLQTERYDLAHIHLGNTPFAFAATNTCLRLGLPTVATFHSALGRREIPFARLMAMALGCANWSGKVHLTAVS
ncbi:MAG: glycosyltransferase, partial [Fimbriimonadaceae bacterium]|nr:glycosyltransferase [Alphaproteobacteria bacterium]